MNYKKELPDYSDDMYLQGYSPEEILMAARQSIMKKKREEDFLEKEILKLVESIVSVSVHQAIDKLFKDWK